MHSFCLCIYLFCSEICSQKKSSSLLSKTHYLYFLLRLFGIYFLGKGKWYPFITGILTFIFLIICLLKNTDLSFGYLSYFCIYPFFLLSNGILTGTGLDSPVVWYNDLENFSIRMGTIPIEDSLYGLLLILSNILAFEWCCKKICLYHL